MNDKKISGNEIKKIRLNLGLTMKEFGQKFDPPASDSIVSRWERGVSLPSSKRMKVISEMNNSNGNYISNYIDQLENKAKERYKEGAKHANDFDLSIIDDAIEKLNDAVRFQKEVIRDNKKVDFKDAAFLNGLYKTIKEMDVDVFSEEDRQRLRGIISLLLSNARDIDIDDIHKQLKDSKSKNNKE